MAEVEAYGKAQKDFFIDMLTRDISLVDCILDLIDNCIDGANRELEHKGVAVNKANRFAGFSAHLDVHATRFSIKDNCGGIPVKLATEHAFAFGKREGALRIKHSVGLYGIGMKRAVFKIGDVIQISSRTKSDSFSTTIKVSEWRKKEDAWNFKLETGPGSAESGTTIAITTVHDDVGLDFRDAEFLVELRRAISRDYMFFLRNGFSITVNRASIKPMAVQLLQGNGYHPLRQTYKLQSTSRKAVDFELIAGLWKRADQQDDDPESGHAVDPGWYVVCNDRIVLAGDTTTKTGWGSEKYIERKWHSQYKPFVGFAIFSADDPATLPWTTTKRGVDLNSEVYRQALTLMASATKHAIEYTNVRKANRVRAENNEGAAARVGLLELRRSAAMQFPAFKSTAERMASVTYQVNERRLKAVKLSLGDPTLPNKDVGLQTFEYYFANEVGS